MSFLIPLLALFGALLTAIALDLSPTESWRLDFEDRHARPRRDDPETEATSLPAPDRDPLPDALELDPRPAARNLLSR